MKKKNGFIASSIIYSFFLVFLMIMLAYSVKNAQTRQLLRIVKDDIQNELNGSTYLIDLIKYIPRVTSGTGIYEVGHSDASITYTTDSTAINNLKMTELRYAGKSPNNYVTFNGENAGWRIIGLVNTPEGQRIKLIRANSIGSYVWDSSENYINYGNGVNDWGFADIMALLNNGPYYNRTSGTCYNGPSNQTTTCDFKNNGLATESKNMIDTITWNIGSNGTANCYSITTGQFYNHERSNEKPRICENGPSCNDYNGRSISWKGQVGLIYPSDYGYATSGGITTNRSTCLSTVLYNWSESKVSDCKNNDWLNEGWTITPGTDSIHASYAFYISTTAAVDNYYVTLNNNTYPSIYLKTNVKVNDGDGSQSNPYVLY